MRTGVQYHGLVEGAADVSIVEQRPLMSPEDLLPLTAPCRQENRSLMAVGESECPGGGGGERVPSLRGLRRLPTVIFVMGALSVTAAAAVAAALVQHGREPNAVASQGDAVAAVTATGTWALRAVSTGCSNWLQIQLGDESYEASADLCSSRCQSTSGCLGFGYQTSACREPGQGSGQSGACLLWSGVCQSERKACWSDFILARNVVPSACPAPTSPAFAGHGQACGGSCINTNLQYGEFAEAWTACGIVPECGAIMKWTDGSYYLRRLSDPPLRGGQSMIYSCGATTTDGPMRGVATNGVSSATSRGLIGSTANSSRKSMGTTFTLNNMDYAKLQADRQLYDELFRRVREDIAGEWGVPAEDVNVAFAHV